jgi:F0F1-type ATP synthase assembly protein I
MRDRPAVEGKIKRLLDQFTCASPAGIIGQVLVGQTAAAAT